MPIPTTTLWSARQRPGRNAVIDWGHPLARQLVFYALPGGADNRDVVTGKLAVYANFNHDHGLGAGPFGPAASADAPVGNSGAIAWPFMPVLYNALQGGHNFTIQVIANITLNNGTYDLLFNLAWDASGTSSPYGIGLERNNGSTIAQCGYADSSNNPQYVNSAANYLITGGGWHVYTVTRAGGTMTFYRDGVSFSATTITDNPMSLNLAGHTFGSANGGPTIMGFGLVQNVQAVTGQTALAAMWARALSAAEVYLLANAPFQVLLDPADPLGGNMLTLKPVPVTPLSGSLEADSALAGALRVDMPGALEGDSALAGALQVRITGALEGDSALAGSLSQIVALTGSLEADSALSGALRINVKGALEGDSVLQGPIPTASGPALPYRPHHHTTVTQY